MESVEPGGIKDMFNYLHVSFVCVSLSLFFLSKLSTKNQMWSELCQLPHTDRETEMHLLVRPLRNTSKAMWTMALTNPCGGKVSQHLPNVIGSDVNQARKFMGRCSSSSCSSFHAISVTILT